MVIETSPESVVILPHSEATEEEEVGEEEDCDVVDLAESMEERDIHDAYDDPAVFAGLVELSRLRKHAPVTLRNKLRQRVIQVPPKDRITTQTTLILTTPMMQLTLMISLLRMAPTQ
jgi:hypothetical protein